MQKTAFIIGAQKAATTSLAYMLDQHPEIALSRTKEPHYYSTAWDNGREWYESQFPQGFKGIWLDASTSYSMVHRAANGEFLKDQPEGLVRAPARIYESQPDARFVYIVRDPIERTYSAYWHNVRAGRENRPFLEAVQDNMRYLAPSQYGTQIARYYDYFEKQSFLILVFEDIVGELPKAASACVKHFALGDAGFEFEDKPAKNVSYQFSWLGRFVRKALGSDERLGAAKTLAKKILPSIAVNAVQKSLTFEVPDLDDEARLLLADKFQGEVEQFKKLTGVKVPIRLPDIV